MVVKVLVVDDSGFFRRRVSEILSADPTIQVIGTATNGKEAIDQALALKPDVITMDYEMPLMDGITAVRHIMQRCPTPVLDVLVADPRRRPRHPRCAGRRGRGLPAEKFRRHLAQPGQGQAAAVRKSPQHFAQQPAHVQLQRAGPS
jgi:CheY-like chemotaxis protein